MPRRRDSIKLQAEMPHNYHITGKPGRRCHFVEAGTTDSHLSSTTCFVGLSEDALIRSLQRI